METTKLEECTRAQAAHAHACATRVLSVSTDESLIWYLIANEITDFSIEIYNAAEE